MKGAIAWLKSNPLTVIAVLVVLGAGAFGFWVYQQSTALSDDIAEYKKEEDKIRKFTRNSVTLPPRELDAAPQDVGGVTFNEAFVNRLQEIFADVSGQAQRTSEAVGSVNFAGKAELMPGFLPNAAGDVFTFRGVYRDATAALLNPAMAQGVSERIGAEVATINAGLPPTDEELAVRVEAIVQEGRQTYGDTITEAQQKQLEAEQRQRLLSMLLGRAQELHLYADPRIGDAVQLNPAFPLSVRPWIYAGGRVPEPHQLWESQLEFWIQSDIIRALRLANRVDEVVGTDENGNEITGNVINGAVKRLLLCEVLPGYVGLHTTGATGTLDPSGEARRGVTRNTGLDRGRSAPAALLPPPPEGAPVAPEAAVTANYHFGPTGRASNQVFDVRHVRLLLHADYQKLPQLYRALGQVNYMTVVDRRIYGLDEFDFGTLGGPFLYGPGDMVEVEVIVETLWLRSWTSKFMPETVRTYLGVPDPSTLTADAG